MKNKQRREPKIIITRAKNPNYEAVAQAFIELARKKYKAQHY